MSLRSQRREVTVAPEGLDQGEAGRGTRSAAALAGVPPGQGWPPSPRPAGVPVSSRFAALMGTDALRRIGRLG